MSTGKRLAKRSIIGTRVCAPGDDGKYYSGVISAVNTPSNGKHDSSNGALSITPQTRYQVRFDPVPASNAGHSKVPDSKREFLDRDLIGPGFSSVCGARLLAGQKVFLTHNGREVQGSVIEHREHLDEVDVIISPNKQESNVTLTKRIDEVRLLESRKSARLADTDTDFARLADMGSDRKRTASQATIDRHDNSNSPYHPNNNRSPSWKPRRRTQSEQSTDNSDNNVTETTTRKYKGNNGSTAYMDYSTDYHYPYTVYVNRSKLTRCSENMLLSADDASAALVLMSLASPSKQQQTPYDKFSCSQYRMMGAIEESSSSGNSNASGSESDNSWRSDTPSPRSAEEYFTAHQQSSSAPNSPKDEGIVPDLLYPHQYSKKRRFINVTEAEDDDEDEQVVSRSSPKYVNVGSSRPQPQAAKPVRREVDFVQTTTTTTMTTTPPTTTTTTTKAKRGRPPTHRRPRSPTPDPLSRDDADSDTENDNSNDQSNIEFLTNGYDLCGKYKCNWREGNTGPICGLKGDIKLLTMHVMKDHLNGTEDDHPDFFIVEDDESFVRNVEAQPTECELPTKSHWDMVKPMSADPEYQMQIHRSQMAAHPVESAMVNGGREIIYMESSGSLSPRENVAPRQNNMSSPPRPANKPIKAKALQQRQFVGCNMNGGNGGGGAGHNNNNNNNSHHHTGNHVTKVSLVQINLGKMPQTTRRGRSDVKKCRKVYGMSHKDQWCTQCKWKKACQRFHMPPIGGGPTTGGPTASEVTSTDHMTVR